MTPTDQWHNYNQCALMAALAEVRAALEHHASDSDRQIPAGSEYRATPVSATLADQESALDRISIIFRLSPFERSVLLLCAGMELSAGWAALCAKAQGDPLCAYPTFSLALAALPDAHWDALSPTAPLRRARLVDLDTSGSVTSGRLQIQERVLHFLAGVEYDDERLAGIMQPVRQSYELVPSHQAHAERIAAIWSQSKGRSPVAVIQLCGGERDGKLAIAQAAAGMLGMGLRSVVPDTLPANPTEWELILRLWERESVLSASALLIDCDELDANDSPRADSAARFIERAPGLVFVSARERRRSPLRQSISIDVKKPTVTEQRILWRSALGSAHELNGHIDNLAAQFDIDAKTIRAASAEALGQASANSLSPGDIDASAQPAALSRALWDACRSNARPRLDDLAERIEACATWDDLVLPEAQRLILRDITGHVRQRATVYETWGFASKGARGLGISALFAGSSGTGKTMAAEVIAHELHLDLYRIDLSSVVSKYIGETEKNLRRVFDAAEEGGVVLLFDEADALFGKRSEVKDSHDRYANIEVSYLLQRMESYRGLAILTTNLQGSLDTAFLRRLRFVVQFPFPDPIQRAEIWRRIFPANAPTDGLDIAKLARLNMAGGNIRNIALNAAFLAADQGAAIGMSHALRAAQAEYAKLDKTLTESEVAGWV